MSDVFISYNREDLPVALRIREALEAGGLSVWWDQNLRSGQNYDEVTEGALRDAKAVIVLWTKRSVVSRWVRAEATLADRKKTLLPVMIEDCERPIMFELIQTADLIGWTGSHDDPRWQVFLRDARMFVGKGNEADELAASQAPTKVVQEAYVATKPSLAVMPFANLSNDPDQTYFVDGLMEEVVGALSRIRTLLVIGSGSTMTLKAQGMSTLEAAKKLGVHYALEGSVRKGGDSLRISATLIDVATGTHIWSDRFDGKLENVFDLQDEVALGVAGVIDFSVQTAEVLKNAKRPTSDLKSYDLYLRALTMFRTYTREGFIEALDLLDQALKLDPDYGLAFSMAANCYGLLLRFGWSDDPEMHSAKLKEMIGQSLRTGSDDPQVLSSIAMIFWATGDFAMAEQLATRSIDLNPGSSLGYLARGNAQVGQGRVEEADKSLQRSVQLDPLSPNRNLQLAAQAAAHLAQGHFMEAATLADEASHISKTMVSLGISASAHGHLGECTTARKVLKELAALTTVPLPQIAAVAYATPENQQIFLKGIAMAQDAAPAS
ncbi:MAG: TIR domain-containing protein [Novosphingobium sp.]